MPRPRTDIKLRIVHAARARFLEDGVDGASLRQIAKEASTSIGMVYYYFPAKDDLFLAVVEEVYVEVLRDLDAALGASQPVHERLLHFYERIARASDLEEQTLRLVMREALVSSARLERLFERFQRGHIPLLMRVLQDGFGDGTFDQRHNPLVVLLSIVALAGPAQFIRRMLAERVPMIGAPKGEELAKLLVGVLFDGVGSKSASPPAPERA